MKKYSKEKKAEKQKLVFKSDIERRKYIEKVFKGTRVMEILEDIDRVVAPFKVQNEKWKKEKQLKISVA